MELKLPFSAWDRGDPSLMTRPTHEEVHHAWPGASRVAGVQEIDNRIQTLPTSIYDDQTRQAIARQIYNDAVFLHYAIQPRPPIHVVVEHGRVSPTGVVRSEVEPAEGGDDRSHHLRRHGRREQIARGAWPLTWPRFITAADRAA